MINYQKRAIAWAEDYLQFKGFILNNHLELIRTMPWSVVWRFSTSEGWIYFKMMDASFSLEPLLLEVLIKRSSLSLPQVVGMNTELNCFLMRDAGMPLRHLMKQTFQEDLLSKALRIQSGIQRTAMNQEKAFLSLGLKDCRLANLPLLYQELLSCEDLLIADGFVSSDIKTLNSLHSLFSKLCNRLTQYGIPETIEHGDFHDNNILIHHGDIIISDWGDATLSHPFFSLVSCLDSAVRHVNLTETHPLYLDLQKAYFENWLEYGSYETLLEAYSLAKKIRYIQFAVSIRRIYNCSGIETFKYCQGFMADSLKKFIKSTTNE